MKKIIISLIVLCFIMWPVSLGFSCTDVFYSNFDRTNTEGLWMHREARYCDTMKLLPDYPNLPATQEWEIGTYRNFTCGNRYYEHCVADGSFDVYYSETCFYKETGQRVISIELLSAEVVDGHLKASWSKSSDPNFSSYKLTISKSDDTYPSYPEDYAGWSSENIETTSLDVDLSGLTLPSGVSSATGIESSADYYVAIGVVDNYQHTIMSNAKSVSIPTSSVPSSPTTPTLTKWMHREGRDCKTKDIIPDAFSLTNPVYVSGKINYALKVGQNDLPTYKFNNNYGLNPTEGTIEVWVNPTDWLSDSAGYWEILSAVNGDGQDIFEFRRGRNVYNLQDMLQFVAYDSSGNFQVWRTAEIPALSWENDTWYHVAVTWSETSHPVIYLNGVAQVMESAYGAATWNIRDFDEGTIYLGQRGNEQVRLHNTYNHAGRAAYDEVRVSKTKRTAAEIADSYNQGAGKELTLDDNSLWLAHFDQSLEIKAAHGFSVQDWAIGSYTNYTCGSRYEEQCINDGSFDKYYSEICYYKETGERIASTTLNSVETDGLNLNVSWDKYAGSDFNSYSLAISKKDDTPNYPENNTGWYTKKQETTSLSVKLDDIYYDGKDTNKFEAGQAYYAVITVVKKTGTALASNVLQFTMPQVIQFNAYAKNLRAGFNIASSDSLGSDEAKIVTGTGEGLGSQIRIFDKNGKLENQCFAYAKNSRFGVRVATGDINGDGDKEIIAAPGKGAIPHIREFNFNCQPISRGFYALDGKFKGGANITAGDVNGDEVDEIIVSASKGGGPQVAVYDAQGNALARFFAYDKAFRGGVKVAAVDIDGDNIMEIVVGTETGSPHIRMFKFSSGQVKLLNPGFFAFEKNYKGGVSLVGGDVDGDRSEEIIVSSGVNKTAIVKVYKSDGKTVLNEYYPYGKNFTGGINIASSDLNKDGKNEIITIPLSSGGPNVKILYF